MTGSGNVLLTMAGYFASLSLFAFGGPIGAIPEMQRSSLDVMHWMTAKEFNDTFAIAQMSPGPNVIIVALIGYHVAGLPGAGVATIAMCGPTCVLAFVLSRVWDRFKAARWRAALQNGLVPVALGLIAASAIVIARTADHGAVAAAITAVTAVVAFATRLNPLWLFAAGGLIGLTGLV
jgi:chromate transporter